MSTLKVSIPPHLREALEPLIGILPPDLEQPIVKALEGTEILYTTLVDLSKWALTEEGKQKLESKHLSSRDYDRINLLAGTVTSPATRLPPPEPQPAPWEVAQEEKNTRRAIAALVNGLFSVVGVGAAVWWASKTTGWTDTMRICLAVAGGLVTAVAEGGLFTIYYNRRENAKKYRQERRERQKKRLHARYLKLNQLEEEKTKSTDFPQTNEEGPAETLDMPDAVEPGPLRRRKKGKEGKAGNGENS